jgi:hypothetical protein
VNDPTGPHRRCATEELRDIEQDAHTNTTRSNCQPDAALGLRGGGARGRVEVQALGRLDADDAAEHELLYARAFALTRAVA